MAKIALPVKFSSAKKNKAKVLREKQMMAFTQVDEEANDKKPKIQFYRKTRAEKCINNI